MIMDRMTWSKAFAVLLTLLCLATAVTYVIYVDRAGNADPRSMPASIVFYGIAFKVCLLASFACAGGWFAYAFTGDPAPKRQAQVTFAYFFVIGSFAVLTIPPFVTSQAIGSELIGIVSGCVADAEGAAQLRCDPDRRPLPATGEQVQGKGVAAAHNQWLVNLGGALRRQSDAACVPTRPGECTLGSSGNRVDITGGLVVPLPLVIIALFGGAVSLSRRVPEIQKRSEPGYVGTAAEPAIDARQAREQLVFQMMQFVSAPLIAITAHQVIEPAGQASAVALAFLAGFGSETILLMIRGVAEGIRPRIVSQPAPATVRVPAAGAGPQAGGAAAGSALAGTQGAPLMLGHEPPGAATASVTTPPAAAPVHIRLCVDDDGVEAGSLALSVDGGAPAGVPNDGCVELALAPGQPHRLEAHGRRAGREVHGELALTADADDEGRPFQLALA
jgi:hypothetical protein